MTYGRTKCLVEMHKNVKGPASSKKENLHFLAPAQTKRMQPILVSCRLGAISKIHWSSDLIGTV